MTTRNVVSVNVTSSNVSDTVNIKWNSLNAAFGSTRPIDWWIISSTDLNNNSVSTYNITLQTSGENWANVVVNGTTINNTGCALSDLTIFSPTINLLNLSQGDNCTFSVQGRSHNYPSGTQALTNNFTGNSTISVPTIPVVICFLEGSEILCGDDIYRPIETLKKGMMIKTEAHGKVAIDVIGQTVHSYSNDLENTDKLYVYKKENNNGMTKDLIITGGHSALVDKLKYKEVKDIVEMLGQIYITDSKLRLPACLDERASVYENYDKVNLYHIALENENSSLNYGIWANGLLVETCQKECLEKYMKVIE